MLPCMLPLVSQMSTMEIGRLSDLQDVLPWLYRPGEHRLLRGHRARIEAFEALPDRVEQGERGADVRPAEKLKGQHRGVGSPGSQA